MFSRKVDLQGIPNSSVTFYRDCPDFLVRANNHDPFVIMLLVGVVMSHTCSLQDAISGLSVFTLSGMVLMQMGSALHNMSRHRGTGSELLVNGPSFGNCSPSRLVLDTEGRPKHFSFALPLRYLSLSLSRSRDSPHPCGMCIAMAKVTLGFCGGISSSTRGHEYHHR